MRKGNLNQDPMYYTDDLMSVVVSKSKFNNPTNYQFAKVSENLRFFYSLGHGYLTSNGNEQFITERTAIKVQPGTEIQLQMKPGTELYEIQLLEKTEEQVFKELVTTQKEFFDSLTGQDKEDWNLVMQGGKDYINPSEPHSEKIKRNIPGLLIAPPYSRFKEDVGNGWNFMYLRASPIIGVGTDANYKMRLQEAQHYHNITAETYVCVGGQLEVIVNKDCHVIQQGGFLTAESGELHTMKSYPKGYYEGITLQWRSIPGDKYTPEGIRTR